MGSASTRAHPGRRPNRAGPALRSWIALWEREREVNTCSPCLAQRKHSLKASLQLVLFMPRRLPRGEL